MIDAVDRQILNIVQDNARSSNADIARQVGMAPSAVLERIRKLEKRGIIQGYTAQLDASSVGLGLLAFIFVRSRDPMANLSAAHQLAEIPEVLEVHHVAGEDCYLIKVRAADPAALGRLLREKVGRISTVVSTRTTVVMETLKGQGSLPIDLPVGDDND